MFDQIYDVRCNQARMVANEYPVQVTIFKDEKQPCRDAIYALLGLPSETFQFDKVGNLGLFIYYYGKK